MLVMLKGDWPGQFRRVVRDADGNETEVLTFNKGEAVDLNGPQLEAVRGDIGAALLEVERDDKDKVTRFRVKDKQPDPPAKPKPLNAEQMTQERLRANENERARMFGQQVAAHKAAPPRADVRQPASHAVEPVRSSGESSVANNNATDAIDAVGRMTSKDRLQQIKDHDKRPSVQRAASERLESLE